MVPDQVTPDHSSLGFANAEARTSVKVMSVISPALVHVNMEDKVSIQQQWQLMDFMSQILDATDKLPLIK